MVRWGGAKINLHDPGNKKGTYHASLLRRPFQTILISANHLD